MHLAAKAIPSVVESPNKVVQMAIPSVLVNITGRLPIRSTGNRRQARWQQGRILPDSFPQ
jgi:hypothetical protein